MIFGLILLFTFRSAGQDSITISGQFNNNSRYAQVVINQFGVGSFPIASAAIVDERFSIKAPKDVAPGVYRLQYGQSGINDYIDIIINGSETAIHFEIDARQPDRLPVFMESKENQLWYDYRREAEAQLLKIHLLEQLLSLYPNTQEPIYLQNETFLKELREAYQEARYAFMQEHPETWACEMVANEVVYFTNPRDQGQLRNYYSREHYWDNIHTTSPKLLNTPLYTTLILNYLQYYMNPDMQFSEEEMVEGFKKSVDAIMQAFAGNPETEAFAFQYLSLGFKELGQESVLQYLDETYQALAEQCLEDQAKEAFEGRIAGYNTLKPGNKAPNIAFKDTDGKKQELYHLKAEQTMLVFWASWCPHCAKEMPKVEQWAKDNPRAKVLAIGLDDDRAAYGAAIKAYPHLLHYSDYKKWEGPAVTDYYIYGTPTFILLDRDKKIIGKYSSFEFADSL